MPYIYASIIQDTHVNCSICKKEICNQVSQDEFEDLKREHDLCQFQGLFSSIVLLPGPGDIELNMGRILLKLLWVTFLNRIVHLLGFRTEKAQMIVMLKKTVRTFPLRT